MAPKRKISLEDTLVTSTVAAKLLGITQQYFNTVVRAGWIKATDKGLYRLIDVIQGYKAFLLDEGRRTSKSAEASKVQAARAAEIEFRLARERGQVIPMTDVVEFLSDTVGAFRSELAGLAAACTRDPEQRAVIESNVNGSIERLRAGFDAGIASFKDGKPPSLGDEEADS